jgi:hypothetical protein
MRIRSNHVVVLTIVAISAFVLFVVLRSPIEAVPGDSPVPVDSQLASEDDFLAEARSLSEKAPAPADPVGSLPGVDDDPAMVPVIAVETTQYDIGVIPNEGLSYGTFVVANRGKAPLKISDIRTSCACTTGKVKRSDSMIPPGQSAEVEVTVDPRRIAGFHSHKTLTIFSNDPATPQVAVDVIAKVDPEFEVVPEEVDFGSVNKGEAASATIVVRQLRDKPVKLKDVEAFGSDSVKDVTYSFSERPRSAWTHLDKAEYEIQIALSPAVSPGAFARYFTISTNVDRLPSMRIPVKGTVNSFYAVVPQYPQRLMLQGASDSQRTYEGTARVSADRPIQIEDLEYDSAMLTVEVLPGGDERHLELHVQTAPGVAKGRVEEEVGFKVRTEEGVYPDRIVARAFVLD